jgi:hypothetical protein
MAPPRDRRVPRFRTVAFGLPALVVVVTWLVTDRTTSVDSCQRGGPLGVGIVGLVLLIAAPPLLTAAEGWRRRKRWTRVVAATVTGALLSVFLVWLATQIWWVGHGCQT